MLWDSKCSPFNYWKNWHAQRWNLAKLTFCVLSTENYKQSRSNTHIDPKCHYLKWNWKINLKRSANINTVLHILLCLYHLGIFFAEWVSVIGKRFKCIFWWGEDLKTIPEKAFIIICTSNYVHYRTIVLYLTNRFHAEMPSDNWGAN